MFHVYPWKLNHTNRLTGFDQLPHQMTANEAGTTGHDRDLVHMSLSDSVWERYCFEDSRAMGFYKS